jgi:hypothetical protein
MLIKNPEFSRRISTWLDEVKDRVITLDPFYTNVTERLGLPLGIETSHPRLSLVVWAKYRKSGDSIMVRDFTIRLRLEKQFDALWKAMRWRRTTM